MKSQYQDMREFYSPHTLDAHLQDHNPMTIRNYYADLLWKIHERIEYWNDIPDVDISFDMVDELKSLLE